MKWWSLHIVQVYKKIGEKTHRKKEKCIMANATMTKTEKRYDYLSYGKGKDGKVLVDTIGFVSAKNIRDAKNGDVRSFGLPLENVQGTVAAMFPDDFNKADIPETVWVNVALFNNENVKLADRFSKAIEGKERIRVRISGVARIHEYNGTKSVEVIANDFHILWAPAYKGTNIGGGTDGYSYVSGTPGSEAGTAVLAVQGNVNRPELRAMPNGKQVLGFSLALNKASKKINYALGTNLSDDAIWVDVAIFDNDHIARGQQAAKVLRQGAAIAGVGFAKVEEFEGKQKIKLSLNDFEVLKFAKDGEGESSTPPVNTQAFEETPFDTDASIDIDDDDLPF